MGVAGRARSQNNNFLKKNSWFFSSPIFFQIWNRKFRFIGAGRVKVLDIESYPVFAEHISQCIAYLADGTLRPDCGQNVINQIIVSRG